MSGLRFLNRGQYEQKQRAGKVKKSSAYSRKKHPSPVWV
ncbi:hypothetical protein QY97_01004 [Bacillus thermotolerans]|uniref:Uncharacterized protein n=1 Tax=Bacillus thermotolerans TaxID=1221996 RepID=A0A0F5ICI0_BACTR|nr:hypothetical protein QY97_01004 [Bacillus thermotolerans]KKB43163.1 hypothetical protein QY95_02149 [Bacillus thermotolerans]KKB43566.1 hypothetical protein QY96_00803 [Bacillus thermotolerans]